MHNEKKRDVRVDSSLWNSFCFLLVIGRLAFQGGSGDCLNHFRRAHDIDKREVELLLLVELLSHAVNVDALAEQEEPLRVRDLPDEDAVAADYANAPEDLTYNKHDRDVECYDRELEVAWRNLRRKCVESHRLRLPQYLYFLFSYLVCGIGRLQDLFDFPVVLAGVEHTQTLLPLC